MIRKTDIWVSGGALRQLQGLMSLSEFHYAARSKLDSSQCKPPTALSPDLPSSMSDSDFIELLWENGQIVMQGQSGRPKKLSVTSAHPLHSSRFLDNDCGDGVTGRAARPATLIGSPGGDFAPATIPGAAAAALNSSQEDDMPPWLNYSIDDYYSELLNDFTGVNANTLPPGNSSNLGPPDKGAATNSTGLNQIVRDLYDVEPHIPRALVATNMPEVGRVRSGPANQLPHQWQNSVQNSRSKPLDFRGAGSSSMVIGQSPGWDLPNCAKAPRQELACTPKPPIPPTPSTSSGVINFSHFSRPASLLKANLHNASRLRSSEKTSTLVTNPMESTLLSSPSAMKSTAQEHLASISRKPILRSPTPPPLQEFAAGTSQSETLSWRDAGVRNTCAAAATPANITDKRPPENVPGQRMGSISIMMPPQNMQHGAEKSLEPGLAPSSVCSGNGGTAESIVPSHKAKRKTAEEESGYQSDNIEDESVGGAKKQPTTRTTCSKRSRAAEVHNQSERRRRDRINEKMRALQELIPNCNKVDKASMLDEAIEYLKSLQLQLQIMSMGGSFCMPPMMLPPAMQRIRPPHMAHFPPMGVGVGMGMGVGYGMGILDINGNPLLPLPPVPSTQFPCSSMGAATGLQSMAPSTSGHPMFGIPSPGVPVPMHCAPPFVALASHSAWPNPAPEVAGIATGTAPPVVVDPAGSKDHCQQNMGTETSLRQGGVPQLPAKAQREKEYASSPMTNDLASNSEGHTNSCAGNGNSSSGGSYD